MINDPTWGPTSMKNSEQGLIVAANFASLSNVAYTLQQAITARRRRSPIEAKPTNNQCELQTILQLIDATQDQAEVFRSRLLREKFARRYYAETCDKRMAVGQAAAKTASSSRIWCDLCNIFEGDLPGPERYAIVFAVQPHCK